MKRLVLFIIATLIELSTFSSCCKEEAKIIDILPDPAIVNVEIGETSTIHINAKYQDGSIKDITSDCDFEIYAGKEFFTLNKNNVTGIAKGGGVINVYYNRKHQGSIVVYVGL